MSVTTQKRIGLTYGGCTFYGTNLDTKCAEQFLPMVEGEGNNVKVVMTFAQVRAVRDAMLGALPISFPYVGDHMKQFELLTVLLSGIGDPKVMRGMQSWIDAKKLVYSLNLKLLKYVADDKDRADHVMQEAARVALKLGFIAENGKSWVKDGKEQLSNMLRKAAAIYEEVSAYDDDS